jgi:hypothetical protein
MAAFGLALVAALALGVVGIASAAAATQHWYTEKGKLASGKSTGFVNSSSKPFVIVWKTSGGTHTFTCSSQKSEGTLENPAMEVAGTAKTSSFVLVNCTISSPAFIGCKIKGGQIAMEPLKGVAIETTIGSTSYPAIEFSPQSGTLLFSPTFTECAQPGYNISWPFYGTFTAISQKAGWALEFKQSNIHGALGTATLEGAGKLTTTGGEGIYIAP